MSKTAVSFAFNSPDRLAPETAVRIRDVAEQLGYTPHPVARMLTQRQTLTIGVLTPQALSVIFSNPFFGAFSEGVAGAAEESRLRPLLHLAAARLAGPGDEPGDGRRRGGDRAVRRPPGGRADPARRACRSSWSTRPPCPSTARSRSTTSGGARAAAEHLIGLGPSRRPGHRRRAAGSSAAAGSRRRDRPAAARLPRRRSAAVGVDIPDERVVVGPAQHRRRRSPPSSGPGRTASARRPCWR